VVASYRDRIGGGETFGYNNDFIAYFPLVEDRGHQQGLFWVNHEYPDPCFIHGNPNPETKTADPARAFEPFPGLVVVPFQGHGFPRADFVGEAELHLVDGKVARIVFRAP
jgi:secreted PhoX family phosphatase